MLEFPNGIRTDEEHDEYLRWVSTHLAEGVVLNLDSQILHRCNCPSMSSDPQKEGATRRSRRICFEKYENYKEWQEPAESQQAYQEYCDACQEPSVEIVDIHGHRQS